MRPSSAQTLPLPLDSDLVRYPDAMTADDDIGPAVPPSSSGCVELLAAGGSWFHLQAVPGPAGGVPPDRQERLH